MFATEYTPNPNGSSWTRTIRVGGANKSELLSKLELAGIRLNDSAHALFADDRFCTSAVNTVVEIAELNVASLGFRNGATFAQIVEQAAAIGLSVCPLELGPYFRLQYVDQPEGFLGQPPSQHRAPPGSVTVASAPLTEDEGIPKGFYLRRIEGALWLRGYRSWPRHIWGPEDVFVFSCNHNAP
jgi:hypothetical protein